MNAYSPVMMGPVPVDFILFALILAGIAFLHRHTLQVAVGGLLAVTIYNFVGEWEAGASASAWVRSNFWLAGPVSALSWRYNSGLMDGPRPTR